MRELTQGSKIMAASNALPLDGSVVKMKGLPFKASAEDIMRFFQGFVLKPENVYLKRHLDGRPNGEVSWSWPAALGLDILDMRLG